MHHTAIQYGASVFTSPPYDWAVKADHLLDSDDDPDVAEELRQEDAEYLAAGWNRHPRLAPDQDPAGRRRVVGRPPQVDRTIPPPSTRRHLHLNQEPHHARPHHHH